MPHPSVDIIVPVWNNPVETRVCLAAVMKHSPEARLIIIDNGSNRQTQLMLEEFSEPLGDSALFISSERNLGLVAAVNMGLARSDSDYAVILRPHVVVTPGWLGGLLEAAQSGIASPCFSRNGAARKTMADRNGFILETCDLTFSALALSGEMRMLIGGFDEQMDGGEWCLKDYVRRAWTRGYRTCVTSRSTVACTSEPVLGSETRRRELYLASRARYLECWGADRHYAVYFGNGAEPGNLVDILETVLNGCRRGHRFTLLLHRHQMLFFHRMGWNRLHTAIESRSLSRFMPRSDLRRSIAALRASSPDLVLVLDAGEAELPGSNAAISLSDLAMALASSETAPSQGAYRLSEVMT